MHDTTATVSSLDHRLAEAMRIERETKAAFRKTILWILLWSGLVQSATYHALKWWDARSKLSAMTSAGWDAFRKQPFYDVRIDEDFINVRMGDTAITMRKDAVCWREKP